MATTLRQILLEIPNPKLRAQMIDHVELAINLVVQRLANRQGPVRIGRLGTFKVVRVKGRRYRHPKTQQLSEIGPRTVVRFKAGRGLKHL